MSGTDLRITITREEDAIVVALIGDLDVYVANDARVYLDEAIDRAVAHSVSRLFLDAAGLRFCDSTGLSLIVQAQAVAEQRGVHLTVRRASEAVLTVTRLSGLDRLVDDTE